MPALTVAALAVAEGPADAVGVVQLACEDDALALTLLRAGAYKAGFVPGTLAESVTIHVPYGAVRGLVRRGRALVLSLDRSVPTPFHRFALARFTEDPAETLAPIHRAHRAVSTLAWAVPAPVGALAAALPSAELAGGALGRASLALLVALVMGAAMRALAAWLAWGGPVSDRHREAFEEAMSARLGLLPAAPRAVVAAGAPGPAPVRPRAPPGPRPAAPAALAAAPPPHVDLTETAAPRPAWGRMVGLAGVAALGVVVALLFVRKYGSTSAPVPADADDSVAAPRVAPPPPPVAPPPPPPRDDRCFCERADSSLWRDGVPVLSVFTTAGPDAPAAPPVSRPGKDDKPEFSYDVVVVNNGAAAIPTTRVVLTYARRDAQNRRVGVTDRGLWWGRPLAPGASVKWSTEGPGTEVRIDPSEEGTLEERGVAPAPADAFFALTRKKHRAVRLHAAVMLAYLHDARAIEALGSIGAPVAPEGWAARRVRAAARPVVACDVRAEGGELSACLFNAGTKPGAGLTLREIQDDEDKPARAWAVRAEVPVHDGVRLSWPLDGEPPGDLVVGDDP